MESSHVGSWHDSSVSRDLAEVLGDTSKTPHGYKAVADAAFCASGALEGRILRPLTDGQRKSMTAGTPQNVYKERLSSAVTSVRQAVSSGFVLQEEGKREGKWFS